MKNNKKEDWIAPKLEILTHTKIMGKENFNVSEQNKTGTDTQAVANAAS
tara:strand:+ start:51 stop:197 length:147 start_codon:yes stop_codon:yes gene_type:complete